MKGLTPLQKFIMDYNIRCIHGLEFEREFQKCLSEIRIGKLSYETIKLLKSRKNAVLQNDFGILPTKIYALNKDVDAENEKDEKDEKIIEEISVKKNGINKIKKRFKNYPNSIERS